MFVSLNNLDVTSWHIKNQQTIFLFLRKENENFEFLI